MSDLTDSPGIAWEFVVAPLVVGGRSELEAVDDELKPGPGWAFPAATA
jgi:hypothetical protein